MAATEDIQGWSTASLTGKIADGVLGSAEVVERFTNDASRLGQLEVRTQIGHPVSKNVTLWLGYVHVVTYARTGRDGIEDQAVQQISWNMGKLLGGSLSSRTRLEQRFQRGVTDVAVRFREQVKLVIPLKKKGLSTVLWVEPFVSLNRTSAARPGIDQVRSFAGLGFKLSKHADLEAGYLNQYLDRANGDFSNHALSVSLGYKF
ncbi:DUF2490 domain-containing protein [Sphingomonas sp. SUN039]|uniref:DUF2490 domain-containing protein n=1 Tax=Sphingomonas sp. SUN039 TaxID=2937787 RepID=UPI00216431D4|nr:DUF2490 domain-containing protein [Sphingomonas sp. SUN039]UVO54238.1 DUF2490 domain-containing protein [Sphingomonas sp. SUN039]